MKRTLCAALACAIVLVMASVAVTQESATLKPSLSAGLTVDVKDVTTLKIKKVITGMPGMTPESETSMTKAYSMKVGQATNGVPTQTTLTVSDFTVANIDADPKKAPRTVPGELKGKTVIATSAADGSFTTDITLTPTGKDDVRTMMLSNHPMFKKFPAGAVTVGAKFNLDQNELKDIFRILTVSGGKAECTFEKTETRNGKKCAAIAVTITEGKAKEVINPTNDLKFEGKGYIWVALEGGVIPFGWDITCKVSGSYEKDMGGKKFKVDLDGTIVAKQDVTVK